MKQATNTPIYINKERNKERNIERNIEETAPGFPFQSPRVFTRNPQALARKSQDFCLHPPGVRELWMCLHDDIFQGTELHGFHGKKKEKSAFSV